MNLQSPARGPGPTTRTRGGWRLPETGPEPAVLPIRHVYDRLGTLGTGRRRLRTGDEDGTPVVAELLQRLADIRQGQVGLLLGERRKLRVPAAGEFFHGTHVDDAIVEELVQLRHQAIQEAAVLPY